MLGEREPGFKELPYDPGDLKPLLSNVAMEVAGKCVEILERMYPSDESRARKVPADLVSKRGDVLGFLLGKTTIEEAVSAIRKRVNSNPVLKANVQVLPFYSDLSLEEQKKVIAVGKVPLPEEIAESLDGDDGTHSE